VPHVELSLTDAPSAPRPRTPADGGSSLQRWASVVVEATEPCLVLDVRAVIVAASPSCAELMGLTRDGDARGRRLREAVLPLVDFTADPAELEESEAHMIPPLLAISSGRMARGLIRVACPESGYVGTLDAIATPLTDGAEVVGSLTFFASI
jgi:PAS domain-containing protein